MFTSKISQETTNKINQELLTGSKMSKISTSLGVDYQNIWYQRQKLVKAGALKPLHAKKTATKRKVAMTKNQNITTSIAAPHRFRLTVNGTSIDINNAKEVAVSPHAVDIKY